MTERLFLADPYLSRFEAEVTAERTHGGKPAVVLTRTAFYPEGGGQPADRGTLAGAAVLDVQEVEGEILHVLDRPVSGKVAGEVELARRFDHMQQHHGQHLLSAAFAAASGAQTLSFHLGPETCTIDLDCSPSRLDERALRDAERRCNETVWRDLPVTARDFSAEERARLPLRKEPSKGDRVVVVEAGGEIVDASPCGGTHPRRTGEVGGVAVLRAQKWGEGKSRVEFVCGGRVVKLLATERAALAQAAAALRCAPAEVAQAAARLSDESLARKKELERAGEALARHEAARLAAGAAPVVAVLAPPVKPAAGYLKSVAAALAAQGKVALLGAVEEERAHLCFARPRGPGPAMGDLVREAVALLGGKGGGAPDLAQGSGPNLSQLDAALAAAKARLA